MKLEKLLSKFKNLPRPVKDSINIMKRNMDNDIVEKIKGSVEEEIQKNMKELLEKGWENKDILTESRNPSNFSLLQVLRPDSKITNITKDYVIILMSSGSNVKHEKKQRRDSNQ